MVSNYYCQKEAIIDALKVIKKIWKIIKNNTFLTISYFRLVMDRVSKMAGFFVTKNQCEKFVECNFNKTILHFLPFWNLKPNFWKPVTSLPTLEKCKKSLFKILICLNSLIKINQTFIYCIFSSFFAIFDDPFWKIIKSSKKFGRKWRKSLFNWHSTRYCIELP